MLSLDEAQRLAALSLARVPSPRTEAAPRAFAASAATPAEEKLAPAAPLFEEPVNRTPEAVFAASRHWSKIDLGLWPSRNFSPKELACGVGRGGSEHVYVTRHDLARLERLRSKLAALLDREVPVIVTSAYRDPAYNRRVGGASGSWHMGHRGSGAFDISAVNLRSLDAIVAFRQAARAAGFTAVVDYPESGFIHVDARPGGGNWSADGAVRSVGGDPGFAGEAWRAFLGDPDQRLERRNRATEARAREAVVAGTSATGAGVAANAAAVDPDGALAIVLQLLPYGLPAAAAIFAAYAAVKYGRGGLAWVASLLRSRSEG